MCSFSDYLWNSEPSFAFLLTHPVTDQRLKALEKQVPSRPGGPLLSDEQWRALKEICKTT
jgi:predicted Zn-dependent protease